MICFLPSSDCHPGGRRGEWNYHGAHRNQRQNRALSFKVPSGNHSLSLHEPLPSKIIEPVVTPSIFAISVILVLEGIQILSTINQHATPVYLRSVLQRCRIASQLGLSQIARYMTVEVRPFPNEGGKEFPLTPNEY